MNRKKEMSEDRNIIINWKNKNKKKMLEYNCISD